MSSQLFPTPQLWAYYPRCKCYSENKTNEFKCPNNPKSPNCGTHLSTVVGPGLNPRVENGATVNTLKCKNIVIISAFFLFLWLHNKHLLCNSECQSWYSRVRNKRSPTFINFWIFSMVYRLIKEPTTAYVY